MIACTYFTLNPAVGTNARRRAEAGGSPAAGWKAWPHNCLEVHPKDELRSSWKMRQRRRFHKRLFAELNEPLDSAAFERVPDLPCRRGAIHGTDGAVEEP